MVKIVEKTLKFAIVLFLGGISFITCLQVFFRFVLQNPLPWPEEIGRLFFIYLTFVGAGLASITNDHISVELIDQISKQNRGKYIFNAIRELLIFIVMIVVLFGGIQLYGKVAKLSLPATGLPRSLMTIAVIIGASIMSLNALRKCIKNIIKTFNYYKKYEESV